MDLFRYIRQRTFLGEIDNKIHDLKVAVIGLGGIGSWSAEILARIGVKELFLIDRSIVDVPDLHRQAYTEDDIGKPKAYAIYSRLKKVNSNVRYSVYFGLNSKNALDILKNVDIIIDGTDNLETRYLINEVSVILNKPWIYASAVRNIGYVAFINPKEYCFYDIFPNKTTEYKCEDVGIFPSTLLSVVSIQLELLVDFLKGKINPIIYRVDMNKKLIERYKIKQNNSCPVCKLNRFKYINKEPKSYECSKINYKHVRDIHKYITSLDAIKIEENEYYIRLQKDGKNIIAFRNGEVWIEK